MGIEPTKPLLAQSFIGFEDRGRHQSDTRFHSGNYTSHACRAIADTRDAHSSFASLPPGTASVQRERSATWPVASSGGVESHASMAVSASR